MGPGRLLAISRLRLRAAARPGAGALLAVLLSLTAAGTALAQQTYPPEVEDQCRDDYFRHCSTYALGSIALRRCMEAKRRDLAPNCQQALKDAGFVRSSGLRRDR